MQYRPTAAELLHDISSLLSDEVLDQVSVEVQHKVRVAANIAQILEREVALAGPNAERELAITRDLLGVPAGDPAPLSELRGRLANALRAGELPARSDDEVWNALVQIARDDLAISKPGHDGWTGDDWSRQS
jgi:hypothetical protein